MNKGLSQKSRLKIKKLCTGVKYCSPSYSEIFFTPNKPSIFEKKIKKTRAIACMRVYEDHNSADFRSCRIRPPQTAPKHENPFCRCRFENREKNRTAAVGQCSVIYARQKKEVFLLPAFDNKNHNILWIGG